MEIWHQYYRGIEQILYMYCTNTLMYCTGNVEVLVIEPILCRYWTNTEDCVGTVVVFRLTSCIYPSDICTGACARLLGRHVLVLHIFNVHQQVKWRINMQSHIAKLMWGYKQSLAGFWDDKHVEVNWSERLACAVTLLSIQY